MIQCLNLKRVDWETIPNALYIGRANNYLNLPHSKWHNPFPMKNEGERKSVLLAFLDYILKDEALINSLHELDDKLLLCYCAPRYCHGMILIKLRELQIENRLSEWKEIEQWIQTVKER